MRLKLFKKYFLATVAIVVFSLAVLLMILSIVFNSYLSNSKYKSMQKTTETIINFYELSNNNSGQLNGGFYYIVSNLGYAGDLDIFVTDLNGKLKLCACEEWRENGVCTHSSVKISEKILKKAVSEKYWGVDTLGSYSNPQNILATPIVSGSKAVGVIFTVSEALPIKSLLITVLKIFALSAIAPIIIMFIALYIMTYRMTKPLKLMSDAAKAMARGDFSKRIPVTSDDEIGELAVSFNQMTNSLTQLEGMRRSFVANVSHELKTPMTTIGGFIDGIIDGTIEAEKQSYYLNIVSEEVKRLSRMVQSMLSLSKLESGQFILKPEKFDFKEMLLSVVISQEQRIEKKNINVNGLDEIFTVVVNADRDLIYQAVYNLVDNAIKFVNEEGTISFYLKSDSKKLIFEIANTGKGIPAEELRFIFERFYKVDKSRSANKNSAGLGLYLVKTILHAHGGKISVKSRENEFTTFKIVLPLPK
ncbi:MAG: HAMP domain-containing sensor histidine kinase [Oscillospiraceae bacterium]|nr:HAMP domain-containing sensor histidine kinase [Oscillospiraceae bacterium]